MDSNGETSQNFGLGLQIAYSVIIAVLVTDLTLICRLKFSKTIMITHLTLWPYRVALLLLMVMLLETSFLLYYSQVLYKDHYFKLLIKLLSDDSIFQNCLLTTTIIKFMLCLLFNVLRAHQQEALVTFVVF